MLPLKILSWNIEHFNGHGGIDRDNRADRLNRVADVADYISAENPDVFALSEVEGSLVYGQLTAKLPGYIFHITEGPQSQELLLGVRIGLTAFFTQRNEFREGNLALRPAALLTLREGNLHISLLFTHFKSGPQPEGFGLRDSMFAKIRSLKRALDKAARRLLDDDNARANFIVAGDMNTMGMDYRGNPNDIPLEREIEVVTKRFAHHATSMVPLAKSNDNTFFNGSGSSYPPSPLDHVFAADHLKFKDLGGHQIRVAGWAEEVTDAAKDAWINRFSDHAPLVFSLTGA